MPLELEEVKNLPKTRPKAGLVDWDAVIEKILKSGKYWTVKEVTDELAEGKVRPFRTKVILDKAVEDGILERFWYERRYVYGPPLK